MNYKVLPFLLALAFLLRAPLQGENYDGSRKIAAAAMTARHYSEALRLLSPILKAHPQDPSLWTLRGLALDGLGETKASLESFDRALSIAKLYAPALEAASQVAYVHRDPRAMQYLQRLLAVAPTNGIANAMAGALAYESHDCGRAVTYFEKSREEVYRNQKAITEFADCLLKTDRLSDAVKVLERGSQQHPESVQLKYNLAVADMRNQNPAAAIQVLEPLKEQKDSGLLNLLASAYSKTNRPDDAFHALENAITIQPQDESNYLDLAILCLEHNQENRSVAAATAGISRIPKAASLFLIRGVAYAQLSRYDKAESDFATAAQIDPEQPHSTIAMSLLYSEKNDPEQEKALLLRQLKVTPNDAVANYLLADVLLRQGAKPGQPKFEEARADLERSLKANPDSAEAQILMGRVCQRLGLLSQALDHFQVAVRIEPDNRSALDPQFLLLRKLHRNNEAAQVLIRLKTVLNSELEREQAASKVRVTSTSTAR